jgi:alkyl sulfatase BDS1-like metallo-beta-lactamase superfamily hydrolase
MTENPAQGLPRAAEPSVAARNRAVLDELPFADRADFEDAARGFIASLPDATVLRDNGQTVWSQKQYSFIDGAAPDTVNPSLWRMASLNTRHGLFKVVDGVYQVRGLDLANMTLVEGDSGVIVVDTLTCMESARAVDEGILLTCMESARAALELYYAHRGRRPVKAVIYTHCHVDHFGGVKGVVGEAQVGAMPILAPHGFMEHAVSENVIAGAAMLRRAAYQFGPLLPAGPRGQVDAGLGKTTARGTVTLLAPTDLIATTGERRVIDGLEFVFQMAPGSEAPAEMHMFVPRYRTLNMAENATHLFHNLLPFRGAEVRDPRAWAFYLNEAIELFAGEADVLVGQHHWPVWGRERIGTYLARHRDLYKYVHDQTLRLMNLGHAPGEIAEELKLPASLAREWHNRDYYGALRHNVRAIYQKYLGWYDANPAHLDPLPPVEAAKKYIDYMGGAGAVIARARKDFAAGEYRWVADVMNRVVFADPSNGQARELCADAFEQLGYLSESSTWRNAYLFGALELRRGVMSAAVNQRNMDTVGAMPTGLFFDYLGVRLNGPKADGKRIVVNWTFTDTRERYVLWLENSALNHVAGRHAADAHATLTLPRAILTEIMRGRTTFPAAIGAGHARIEGDARALAELFGLFDDFDSRFAIVEP